ncbi:hypothetical protein [Nostoc sp. 'Peltigera membranacea cyanobiont' 210A]|nr:hypothetical protein [Nostoc sp. 'Peltigera membranacea cyanobiont' 210A]
MTVFLTTTDRYSLFNQPITQFLEVMPTAVNYASNQIGDFFLSKVP